MRKRVLFVCVFVILTSLIGSGLAADSDPKSGLWQAIHPESGTAMFFLVYNGDSSRVYDFDWKRSRTKLSIDGDSLQIIVFQGTVQHRISARFESGTWTGTWLRPHPQVRAEAAWKATRISPDPDWDPWKFLHKSKGGSIDLVTAIVEAGPYEDEAAFRKTWQAQIEPLHFALLTKTLYAGPAGNYSGKLRTERIKALYQSVKRDFDTLKDRAARFADLEKSVGKDLRRLFPWLKYPGNTVLNFSLDEFDYQFVVLNAAGETPRGFMVFGLDWIDQNLSETQARYLIAQGLLDLEHNSAANPSPFIRAEFAQRGITSLLSRSLAYSEDPKDFLFQKEKDPEILLEDFRDMIAKLKQNLGEKTWRVRSDFFLTEHRDSSYLLSFDFARVLSQRFEPQRLLMDFPYERLGDEWASYLRSLRTIPQVDPPPNTSEVKAKDGKIGSR